MKTPDLGLPAGVEVHVDDTPDQVALALADAVAEVLASRLEQAEQASLVVSGGSTPLPFFKALAQKSLAWSRVDVLLADERWVPEDHPDSNTRLVKASLLQGPAAAARYLSLKQPGDTPAEGLAAASAAVADLELPLDVVILGMGNDGHTASLFPDAPELAHALSAACPDRVAPASPPSQSQQRITLTRPVLQGARFTALHLKGQDKLDTLQRALAEPDNLAAMPIRAFLTPGLNLFWSP